MPPGNAATVVPLDDAWPMHCGQPMWFRGGTRPKFYCDCGHERPPLPTEVREVTGIHKGLRQPEARRD